MPVVLYAGAWLSRVPRRHRAKPRVQTLLSRRLTLSAPMRTLSLWLAAPAPLRLATTDVYTRGSRQHALPRLRSADRMFTFRRARDFVVVARYCTYRV